ncbi:MAG TPA: nucleotidyltransferase family protein [Pseudoxanthomonas sp.]|nr:nucleotidyltransferase family protein [Pseudoxanthomonas sp.]
MTSGSHVAIVLAAGGSRRLGRAKQLLTRDGETLVHRAVRLALETKPLRTLLVTGGRGDAIGDAVADLGVEIVFNAAWEEGLASSLRAAALALEGSAVPCLILGCDQPALQLSHLQALLQGAASSTSGCAVTRHGEVRGIPVVVGTAMLVEEARELSGDRGLRAALQRLPCDAIHLLEAEALQFDLDTEANVQHAIKAGWLDR